MTARASPAAPHALRSPNQQTDRSDLAAPAAFAPADERDGANGGAPRRRPRGPRGPDEVDPRPGRIPGLDGIRAIAIISVLIYHFTPTALPGGFIGVDVFFVLSGFLITTVLLRNVAFRGRLHLGQFWLRRARRLVPALVTVVVVSVSAALIVGGDLLVGIGRQTLGAFTFSTNWVEIGAGSSYFHHTSPLLFVNFWSLAVEEQFYLLWPLLLGLLLAFTVRARHRTVFALALAAGSALWMAVLFTPGEDATRVYYGTDTHLFGLMVGAGLAFAWAGPGRAGLRHRTWQRWRGWAVAGSLTLLIVLMRGLTDSSTWTFRGGLLLACVATAVLIAGLLERGGLWRRVMSLGPLTWIGSRSYGIYLWHWPVLTIVGEVFPYAHGTGRGTIVLLSALAVTFALSEASYRLIELPVREHGFREAGRRARRWVATPWQLSRAPRVIAALAAVVLALSVIAVLTAPGASQTQRAIEEAEARLNDEAEAGGGSAPGEAPAPAPTASAEPGTEPGTEEAAPADDAPPDPAAEEAEPTEVAERFSGYSLDDSGLLVPESATMTAIGDSLVVTSADGLTWRFPDINYDARSNRQWGDAMPVLNEAMATGQVRENVIVHFGTNAGVDESALREFIDALGPERNVVVMNLYSRSTFVPGSNEAIARVAADYPNVVVGDWNAAMTAEPQTLQSDGIHPDIDGMHVYARVVAESFDTLARGN